ncbi:hypothetical protein PWT90_04036 [Aphanocladium album]|nr:hypothetical protein PWT90_04036 [Aphanocladium album]
MVADEPSFPADAFSKEVASGILRETLPYSQANAMPSVARLREGMLGSISIFDADAEAVDCLVQYIYTGGYDTPFDPSPTLHDVGFVPSQSEPLADTEIESSKRNQQIVLTHAKVVALADKYIMRKLAATAFDRFAISLDLGINRMVFLSVVAFLYALECQSNTKLRQKCVTAAQQSFGPQMAVGNENRQRIDYATAHTEDFATDLLQASFLIAAAAPKK